MVDFMTPSLIPRDLTVGDCILSKHDKFFESGVLYPGCSTWVKELYANLKSLSVIKLLNPDKTVMQAEWNKLRLETHMVSLSDMLWTWLHPSLAAETECVSLYKQILTRRTAESTLDVLLDPSVYGHYAKKDMMTFVICSGMIEDQDPRYILSKAVARNSEVFNALVRGRTSAIVPRVSDVAKAFSNRNPTFLTTLLGKLFPKWGLCNRSNLIYSMIWLPWETIPPLHDTYRALSEGPLELFDMLVQRAVHFSQERDPVFRDCLVRCCLSKDQQVTFQKLEILMCANIFPHEFALSKRTLELATELGCAHFLQCLTAALKCLFRRRQRSPEVVNRERNE